MTMIEKVAAAIRSVHFHEMGSYEDAARAAIEAMREPTLAMLKNGEDVTGVQYIAEGCYLAMIDAALEEK